MIADWTVPFALRSLYYSGSDLPINQEIPNILGDLSGYYLLRQEGCALRNTVRAQKQDIPQAEGAILPRRFLSGMEMDLAIQLWQTKSKIACDDLQQAMLDSLMGYLYNLINADDNVGRVYWTPHNSTVTGGDRMLDDIRLLSYPAVTTVQGGVGIEVTVTVDCQLPYEANTTEGPIEAPGNVVLTGTQDVEVPGNRWNYPVFQIYSGEFQLRNVTTGYEFHFNQNQPGCPDVGGGYVEINTLKNTVYLNGDGANMKAGIVMDESDFWVLVPGTNTIDLNDGLGSSQLIFNGAWA